MASSSSSHANPFHSRPASRIPSNSSSASSSSSSSSYLHSNHRNHWSHIHPADMPDERFTSEMRDRQARGKDPYLPEAADSGHMSGGGGGGGGRGGNMHHHSSGMRNRGAVGSGGGGGNSSGAGGVSSRQHPKEPFQKTERRDWAETVLDNPELLLMYAQSSGDTLPATRHKFKKIMCGLDEYDEDDMSIGGGGGGGQYPQQVQHNQQQQQRFNGVSWSNYNGDGGGGSRSGRR